MMSFGCLRRQQLICRLSRQQLRQGLVLLQSNGQSKAKLARPHERPHNAFYTAAARGAGTAAAAAAAAQGSTPTTRLKPLAAAGPNGTLAPRPRSQTAEDAFYAEQATTFADLGIVQAVADALQAAGFTRPSRVQELALPQILSGKDMVLAAETGSGKTLAYIAPIASHLLKAKEAATVAATPDTTTAAAPEDRRWRQQMALVLCPNVALCQQVVRLVGLLQQPISSSSSSSGSSSQPLLRACHISSSTPPPFEQPDIVVTTPGALVTMFNDRGYSYGSRWTAEGVSSRTAFVVVDEADLLSQGGYIKDLHRLLDAFKSGERREIEAKVMQELGITEERFRSLPRHLKQACWEAGAPGLIKAGFRPGAQQQQQHNQESAAGHSPASDAAAQGLATGQDNILDSSSLASTSSSLASSGSIGSSSNSTSGPYGPYFKRQYLFIAATMPALTKADVGTALQKRFQDAVWVSGNLLHQVKPHVDHSWVHVTPESADSALINAINQDPDYQSGQAKILVFARESAGADRVSAVLATAGVPNVLYHKNVPKEQRDAALTTMLGAAISSLPGSSDADGSSSSHGASSNAVMVSTDAAARGIDLPDITHVIQADFSQTAIEFLHRVGRTARAGKGGKVTSLFGDSDSVLVGALRQYINDGKPIEDCFSRNRSFSKKVKRYGKFVPRGQRP